ncbi:hypothetical protein WICPIJ_008638 [Wickerhamomyces pijperi]|uniref:Splicing factor YJU2 n=1 Tax=Wickerhamomyces pijperi TaxID=599730 RepID=A0A9P8PW87_WICPI|nr:hypothetical protein WICPIJ_008638 [Wickerhamomyces pijperi]
MSERKSINKYYPPDYDPSKVVKTKNRKVKKGHAAMPTIRLMTPFSMICLNCNEWISKSRKFNARKESTNETYLKMKIVKLHIRCPKCAQEIIFRTDPKSADFVMESGGKRAFDKENKNKVLKEETLEETLSRLEREEREAREKELAKDKKQTSLEELEKKLVDMKRQQDMNEEIDLLHKKTLRIQDSLEKQHELNEKLKMTQLERQKLQEDEDEKLAEKAFQKTRKKIFDAIEVEDDANSDHEEQQDTLPATSQQEDTVQSKDTATVSASDSDSDSDSDYDQPLNFMNKPKTQTAPQTLTLKRKTNSLGISIKKKLKN